MLGDEVPLSLSAGRMPSAAAAMQAFGYTHTVATGHTDLQPGVSQKQCVDRTGSFLGQHLLLPVNKLQACREGAAFLYSFFPSYC